MKICWDNLENVRYDTKTNKFYVKGRGYFYHDSCKECNEPYLGTKSAKYCSNSCINKTVSDKTRTKMSIAQSGENNPLWNKNHTEETKIKISIAKTGKKNSEEHCKNISLAFSGSKSLLWKGGYNNIPLYDTYAPQLEPIEECRRNEKDPNILEVKCTYCGKWYVPLTWTVKRRVNNIKGTGDGRFYCLDTCKQECPIFRQKKYPKGYIGYNSREVQPQLRQLVFERDNWTCQKCGSQCSLHCHHIDPVVSNPIESADVDNSITLCKDCHKWVHMNIKNCGYGYLSNCINL